MTTATASSSDSSVLVSVAEGVMTIILNDERHANALTPSVREGLAAALDRARGPAVRAVIISGGERVFCAGGDLRSLGSDFAEPTRARSHMLEAYARVLRPLIDLEKPTIAAISGAVAGAGLSLALACDLRVAARTARLHFAFAKVGLVPDLGAGYLLPRAIGNARAKELAFLHDQVSADVAMQWGLVSEVVGEGLLARAQEVARRLADGPTRAFGLTKRLFEAGTTSSLDEFVQLEAALQGVAASDSEHREGITAFLEKRPAQFIPAGDSAAS